MPKQRSPRAQHHGFLGWEGAAEGNQVTATATTTGTRSTLSTYLQTIPGSMLMRRNAESKRRKPRTRNIGNQHLIEVGMEKHLIWVKTLKSKDDSRDFPSEAILHNICAQIFQWDFFFRWWGNRRRHTSNITYHSPEKSIIFSHCSVLRDVKFGWSTVSSFLLILLAMLSSKKLCETAISVCKTSLCFCDLVFFVSNQWWQGLAALFISFLLFLQQISIGTMLHFYSVSFGLLLNSPCGEYLNSSPMVKA